MITVIPRYRNMIYACISQRSTMRLLVVAVLTIMAGSRPQQFHFPSGVPSGMPGVAPGADGDNPNEGMGGGMPGVTPMNFEGVMLSGMAPFAAATTAKPGAARTATTSRSAFGGGGIPGVSPPPFAMPLAAAAPAAPDGNPVGKKDASIAEEDE